MRPFAILVAVLLALPVAAEPAPSSPHLHALNKAGVRSFLDAYLPGAMASRHIPGLAITVVQGNEPLVTKGYGVSNIRTRQPVDPRNTLFDVQSVSKLVVSSAVMIARDRGEVSLHRDINHYLKGFTIPATFPQPVTLAALMTHTSGLEDRGIGITARTAGQTIPLGTYLARSLTRRVAPPFTDLLYTDQGMSLAAYTVQSATGVPYGTFVRKNIFDPLKMTHSFYFQVPARLKADRSAAYSFEGGKLVRIPHYYYNIWPTSSLWTTAADMSHFIIMQLGDGVYDGHRILSHSAISLLHTRHFSYDPLMPGVCFDFFEHFENGHRLLIHSGGGSGFVSELMIMPKENIGYFFSYNGYDGSLIAAFRSAFLRHFFPKSSTPPGKQGIRMSRAQLAPYAGWYWSTRYDRRHIGKLSSLLGGYIHVSPRKGGLNIGNRPFHPLTPKVFVDGQANVPEYVAFRHNAAGKVTELMPADSEAPYHRVNWYYSQPVQLGLIALAALGFIVTLVHIAAGAWRHGLASTVRDRARLWLTLCAAADLICLTLLLIILAGSSTPSGAVAFELGLGAGMRTLLVFMTGFAVATVTAPAISIMAWRRNERPWAVTTAFLGIAAAGYLWFILTWNLAFWAA